jgi:hypothetical protein
MIVDSGKDEAVHPENHLVHVAIAIVKPLVKDALSRCVAVCHAHTETLLDY